ncbi:MAG: hypothetical protein WBO19_01285, partial [Terriglobia bacterium]
MGKGHRKGWKKEELKGLSKSQPREESTAVESKHQTRKKPLFQRLLDFIEHPLFLGAVFLVGGLVGMFFFTPILMICGCCILLAFHRAKVVEGEKPLVQVAAYLLLFALTTGSLYEVGIIIRKKVPSFPTNEELRQIVTKAVSDTLSKRTPLTETHNQPSKPESPKKEAEKPCTPKDPRDSYIPPKGPLVRFDGGFFPPSQSIC